MKTKKQSPALQFVGFMWEHVQEASPHSWLRLNHALSDTLLLAVRSGLRFDLGDLKTIRETMRTGYWAQWERLYSDAIVYRNRSAWKAFEHMTGRVPFIIPGATLPGTGGHGIARLAVHAEFRWKGRRVWVTSFNDDNHTLVACAYANDNRYSGAPEKRYTISHADIKESRKSKAPTKAES